MDKKILIDYEKLNKIIANTSMETSLYSKEFHKINLQLTNDIYYIAPTAYLVSGYRGVGKSTLIKSLENTLIKEKNERCIFINLNLARFQETPIILRKISRALYKALLKYEECHGEIDEHVKEKAKLLYLKTFFDVTDSYNLLTKSDESKLTTLKFDWKTLINNISLPILFVFLSILLNTTYLNNNLILNIVILITSVLWSSISLNSVFKKENLKRNKNELAIKSLYDNDIAEVELLELIELLRRDKKNIIDKKIVLVIDEIDKIDNNVQVNTLINELKPLVLSNSIYTIFITGQHLYYEHYFSNTRDDAVISSLFSKNFHVPIVPQKTFENIFNSIVLEKESSEEKLKNSYMKAKILESNRIPRRFFNLIIQDIHWEGDRACISVSKDQEHYYKWVSDVLDILEDIESEIDENEYPQGIIDFIINQHHNWIKKIISFGVGRFTKEMLLETINESHPLKDYKIIDMFLDELLNKLVKVEKIEEIKEDRGNYQIKYNKNLVKGLMGKGDTFSTEITNQYVDKVFSLNDLITNIYELEFKKKV